MVCGDPTVSLKKNFAFLKALYPNAEIILTNHNCNQTDFAMLAIRDTMVFHMVDYKYNRVLDLLDNTSNSTLEVFSLYSVVIGSVKKDHDLFRRGEDSYFCKSNLRLHTEWKIEHEQKIEPTKFCEERQRYLKDILTNLSPSEYLYQCIAMVGQGCNECALASSYGSNHQCPMAQLAVADCYRTGLFVYDNKDIAYQWSKLAAIQGYRPAQKRIAEDLLDGIEGDSAIANGLSLLKDLALKGDLECLRRYVSFRENQMAEALNQELLNAMVCLAEQGDETMLTRFFDAFEKGNMGFPIDPAQQKEWEEVAISKGEQTFLRKIINRHIEMEKWEEAYSRIKQLLNITHDDETKQVMLQVANHIVDAVGDDNQRVWLGLKYLYGYNGVEIDKTLARKLIERAAKAGIPMAKGLLGRLYDDDLETYYCSEKGLSLIREAVLLNDPLSIEAYILETIPRLNDGSISDRKIKSCLNSAVSDGNPFALYVKAHCAYETGYFRMAATKVFDIVKKMAKEKYPPALSLLSCLYEKGFGTKPDKDKQIGYLKKAADLGDVFALGRYGLYLYEEQGDYSCSFTFLNAAYKKGSLDGRVHYRLACCFRDGHGCKKDVYAYEFYMDSAAYYGVLAAQIELCRYNFEDTDKGTRDVEACAKYGEMAIKQGEKSVRFATAYSQDKVGNKKRAKELYYELCCEGDAAAMNNYACLLTDERERIEWYQKAVKKGCVYGLYNLGIKYRDGNEYITKDVEKGVRLLKEAADHGCASAMEELARMYEKGDCVPLDGIAALSWYKAAIDKRRFIRLMDVARLYKEGVVIQRDIDKAIEYYRLAIDKEFHIAQFWLGDLFENGFGRPVDMEKAIYWYRSAAKANVEKAKVRLKELGVDSLLGDKNADVQTK